MTSKPTGKTIFQFLQLISLLGVLFLPPYCLAEDSPDRLGQFLSNLETLSTPFEQTLLNQYGEELEKSTGMLYIRRPGMFHWAYTSPFVQYLISDGMTLWVYDEDLEQVSIRDISGLIEDSPAAILGGDVDIHAHYVVIESASDELDWLDLTPRDPESQYALIRLAFRDTQLSKMILFDNLGQTTQIVLEAVERNEDLDMSLFQFVPPEGVDVIDTRQ